MYRNNVPWWLCWSYIMDLYEILNITPGDLGWYFCTTIIYHSRAPTDDCQNMKRP